MESSSSSNLRAPLRDSGWAITSSIAYRAESDVSYAVPGDPFANGFPLPPFALVRQTAASVSNLADHTDPAIPQRYSHSSDCPRRGPAQVAQSALIKTTNRFEPPIRQRA
jgi:hypothetical protein